MEEYAGGIIGWERLWRARLGALGCGSAVSTAPSRRRQSEPRHPCCGWIRLSVHSRASPAPRRAGAGASGRRGRRAAAAGGAASELSAAGRLGLDPQRSRRGGARAQALLELCAGHWGGRAGRRAASCGRRGRLGRRQGRLSVLTSASPSATHTATPASLQPCLRPRPRPR